MQTVHTDAKSWDELWDGVAGPASGQATSKIGRRRDGSVERAFLKILSKQNELSAANGFSGRPRCLRA
jgi:hypothetical protein